MASQFYCIKHHVERNRYSVFYGNFLQSVIRTSGANYHKDLVDSYIRSADVFLNHSYLIVMNVYSNMNAVLSSTIATNMKFLSREIL